MKPFSLYSTALVVIDVQKGFDNMEAAGMRRNNPGAVDQIGKLISGFRSRGALVVHIRHAGVAPTSAFRPDGTGYSVQDAAREEPGESVFVKSVNSAFIGTGLEEFLRLKQIETLVIVGATTNHCVETTTRMAGNLGFDARLVRDATWTFDRIGPDGDRYSAEEIHAMTLTNLSEEFAEIVKTADVLEQLGVKP